MYILNGCCQRIIWFSDAFLGVRLRNPEKSRYFKKKENTIFIWVLANSSQEILFHILACGAVIHIAQSLLHGSALAVMLKHYPGVATVKLGYCEELPLQWGGKTAIDCNSINLPVLQYTTQLIRRICMISHYFLIEGQYHLLTHLHFVLMKNNNKKKVQKGSGQENLHLYHRN